MRRLLAVVAALAAALSLAFGVGVVLTAPDTELPWFVFGSGGNSSSSVNHLGSTTGQSPIGVSSNDSGGLCAGFWCGVALVTPTPTATPTSTPTVTPTPTKDPTVDTDSDGCTDVAEQQPKSSAAQGGGRNPKYFWDFYDVWAQVEKEPGVWEWQRDKVINIFDDILGVAGRFGARRAGGAPTKEQALAEALTPPAVDNKTGYHAAFDRGAQVGPNAWDLGPPDGAINVFDDIFGVAAQFGHSCA